MKKYLALAAAAAAFVASPALAADYTFQFTSDYQPAYLISGTIEGLVEDGTGQAATHIYVTGLPNQSGPFDVTTWGLYANSFDVSGGVINASSSLADFIGPDGSFFLGDPSVGNGTAARFDVSAGGSYAFAATSSFATYSLSTTGTGEVGPIVGSSPPTGAVPEPATWAMMLIGFGGVGFAMRRKRSPVLVATA